MIVGVTGAAGAIGHRLVARLAPRVPVRSLDLRDGRDTWGSWDVEHFQADLGASDDHPTIAAFVAGCDAIVHLAGLTGGVPSMEDPIAYHRANVTATLRLIETAEGAGVQRIVFASTQCVFGNADRAPLSELQEPHPSSIYGVTKLLGERYLQLWAGRGGELTTLRFPRLFDPKAPNVASRLLQRILRDEEIEVYGPPGYRFDLAHIDDAVALIEASLESPELRGLVHLGGEGFTVMDIVDALAGELGWEPRVVDRSGDAGPSLLESSLCPNPMVFATPTRAEQLGFSGCRSVASEVRALARTAREDGS